MSIYHYVAHYSEAITRPCIETEVKLLQLQHIRIVANISFYAVPFADGISDHRMRVTKLSSSMHQLTQD